MLNSIIEPVESSVDPSCQRAELISIGELIQASRLPEPAGRSARPFGLLKQFGISHQVKPKTSATSSIVRAAGHLQQPPAAICGAIARLRIAEINTPFIGIAIGELAGVSKRTGLMTYLGEESRLSARSVNAKFLHC